MNGARTILKSCLHVHYFSTLKGPKKATIIDGKKIANDIRSALRIKNANLYETFGQKPTLGLIVVGHESNTRRYVRSKIKACTDAGIQSLDMCLPATISQIDLEAHIERMNHNTDIDGILLQLPLPPHLDTARMIERIDPEKDIDGLHPLNIGKLAQAHEPTYFPCTPLAILTLLERMDIGVAGKVAVVIGRSRLVGMPVANLLRRANATVIHCHSYTTTLEELVSLGDIVIVAMGQSRAIPGSWFRSDATVIDVGINHEPGQNGVLGDVCFDQALEQVAAITPVPGGVGPMTIAMLVQNVSLAFERKLNRAVRKSQD